MNAALGQIMKAWADGIFSGPAWAWLILLVVPLLVVLRRRTTIGSDRSGKVLFVLAVALALLAAWNARWIGDDAFITFRYARNFLDGHGIVFNPGERVEGYTDFLWLMIVAGGMALGAHPVHVSVIGGLASLGMALWAIQATTLTLRDRSVEPANGSMTPAWPALGVLLAGSSALIASHGTSGLETMFVATLVVLAALAAERDRPLLAGCLAIASTLAHPDHAIFYAAIGLALVLRRAPLRSLARYSVAFFAFFVPYFLWRWSYYGDLVPNTFHAKSADQAYFSQGIVYVVLCVLAMGLWAWLPLALIGLRAHLRSVLGLTCLVGVPIYCVYIAKIGGDFMLGRLFITPALLLAALASLGFERLLARDAFLKAGVLGALAMTSAIAPIIVPPGTKSWHVADEASFYRLDSWSPPRIDSFYWKEAEALRTNVVDRGLRPKIALDCIGMGGMNTGLPIFDLFGLTNREVALTPLARRGRPGHEKMASPGQILASGAELSKWPVFPDPYAPLTAVALDGFPFYLTRNAPPLGLALAAAGQTRDGAHVVRAIADAQGRRDPLGSACDLWFVREYYFRHQADPELASHWLSVMTTALPPDEARELLLMGRDPAELHHAPGFALHFDAPLEGWTSEGDAFAGNPVTHPGLGQDEVIPREGGFIDSFPRGGGSGGVGSLLSPPFTLDGDILTLLIGGSGADGCVSLIVAGTEARRACGCGSDILRREIWPLSDLRGQEARLRFTDISPEGHVVADEVILWGRR